MLKFNFVKFFKNLDKSVLLYISVAVAAVIIVGTLVLTNESSADFLSKIKNFRVGGVSKDNLAKKGIDYINSSILSGQTAALVSSSEESGLIKMRIKIGQNEFDSYMTKDGKLLFPEAIKIDKEQDQKQTVAPAVQNNQPTTEQVKQAPGCGV